MKNKILYVICVAYFVAGFSLFSTNVDVSVLRQIDPSIRAHTEMFTLRQIGLIFMTLTTMAAILGIMNRVTQAYSLLTFTLVWWAMLYLVSWAETGYWQSVYGFVNYGLTATVLILCSRIVEVNRMPYANVLLPLLEREYKARGQEEG